jgi:hypothetical protein
MNLERIFFIALITYFGLALIALMVAAVLR